MSFVSAVIVAGGSGRRMGASIPKQFLCIKDIPLLDYTLLKFINFSNIDEIIIVLPEDNLSWFSDCFFSKYGNIEKLKFVPGGKERQDSVFNGIFSVSDQSLLTIVHDGVRPFIDEDLISQLIETALKSDGAIPGLPVFETIKKTDDTGKIISTVPRENIYLSQTPQIFKTEILKKLHLKAREDGISATDDAELFEVYGYEIKVINGRRENIKITTPSDLEFAEKILIDTNLAG